LCRSYAAVTALASGHGEQDSGVGVGREDLPPENGCREVDRRAVFAQQRVPIDGSPATALSHLSVSCGRSMAFSSPTDVVWEAPDTLPTGGVMLGRDAIREQNGGTMGRKVGVGLFVLALVTVVVGVDVLFFRHRFWERLMVNVGIVLVFAAFDLRFLKRA
jgi:hypothetical protein